jgi:hypothetical protein
MNIYENKSKVLNSSREHPNLPTSLYEQTSKTWKNPKPHWHPQLPTTQVLKTLGILMRSKRVT